MNSYNPWNFPGFKIALNCLVLVLSVGLCRDASAQLRFDVTDFVTGSSSLNIFDIGDVNEDLNLDFVGYQVSKDLSVFLADGKGNFTKSLAPTIPNPAATVKLADVDGDSKLDMVILDTANVIRFMKGAGNGSFAAANTIQLGTATQRILLADLNSDGRPDIVLFQRFTGSTSVMLSQSGFTYSQPISTKHADLLAAFGIADMNNDGKMDLFVQGSTSGTKKMILLLGSGNGTFTKRSEVIVPVDLREELKSSDINGDGVTDIVGANGFGGFVIVKGNSTTGLGGVVSVPGVAGSSTVDLGDLNKDNKVDIVVSLRDQMKVIAFINEGDDSFLSQQLLAGTYFQGASVADFDRDSDLDILCPETAGVRLLINQTGAINSFTFNRTTFGVGNFITGKITLSKAAIAGGEVVQVSSSAPSIAFNPRSVIVPEGLTDAYFDVTGHAIGSATIGVTFNGITKSIPVTVQSNSSCSVAPLPPSELRILENP